MPSFLMCHSSWLCAPAVLEFAEIYLWYSERLFQYNGSVVFSRDPDMSGCTSQSNVRHVQQIYQILHTVSAKT